MLTIPLRDYQTDAINRLRETLRRVRRVLFQLPTGGGKSRVGVFMAYFAMQKGFQVWWLTHRRELIHQCQEAFNEFGIPTGIIGAGFRQDSRQAIQICSVPSLYKRHSTLKPPQLIIYDECHRIAGRTWQTIHDGYPQAFHIGLTATPCRSDHKGLGSWFDEIVLGPTVRELIDGGYLSKYRIFAPTMPDLSKVHAVAGDFDQRELDEVLRRTTIVGDTVADYKKYNMGKRGLIFTWSVQASVDIARQFQDAGIPAAHIDGETDSQTRDAAVQAFRDNRIKILSNCSIVTEGFNLVGVEICDILKPTKSVGLYLQMVGRALRAAPDKQEARIYDRSGNWARLGLPDDEREWTLEGLDASKRKKKKEPQQTTKVCVSCWMVVARTVAICPTCGYVFPVQPMEADTADGELQELDIEALRIRQVKQEQANAKDLQSLIRVGKARGMRSPYGWAVNVLKAREAKKAAKEIAKAARAEDEERWLAGW